LDCKAAERRPFIFEPGEIILDLAKFAYFYDEKGRIFSDHLITLAANDFPRIHRRVK